MCRGPAGAQLQEGARKTTAKKVWGIHSEALWPSEAWEGYTNREHVGPNSGSSVKNLSAPTWSSA